MHSEKNPAVPEESGLPLTASKRMARQGAEPVFKGLVPSGWRRHLTLSGLVFQLALQRFRTLLWSRAYDWVSRGRARAKEKDWITLGQLLQKKLGALKGPLMKFGQMASYLDERLATSFRDLLAALQERSPSLDPAIIRSVVEASLGAPISVKFAEWEDKPLAAASIAQIHLARLHTGERVAVKVKYPGMETAIRSDLRVIRMLAPWLSKRLGITNIRQLLDEFGSMVMGECDFIAEAEHQEIFRQAFANDPGIVIPRVFVSHSSKDVITMDYIDGKSFADFFAEATPEQKNHAGQIIAHVAVASIHRHAIYNGDPHPGNYLFLTDGRVAFLDFGFTRRWSPYFINQHKRQALTAYEDDLEHFTQVAKSMGYESGSPSAYSDLLKALQEGPYSSWIQDRPFRFTHAFVRSELQGIAALYQKHSPIKLSQTHLILQRVMWGQHALFAALNAEINLHQLVLPLIRKPLTERDLLPVTGASQPEVQTIRVRPIRNIFELWEVYRLTHECYVETGYIQSRPTGLLVHYAEFDHIPETMILVAVQGQEIVGSVSFTLEGPSGFVIEKDYPEVCQKLREEGRTLADIWRLVVKKSCRSGRQVLMSLLTETVKSVRFNGVNTVLLEVHEKHAKTYEHYWSMTRLARRKGVEGLEKQNIPAVLLRGDEEKLPKGWR